MVAVVANGRQGGDPCLLGSTAVPKRDWVAVLGTAARVKAPPAVDAVAVALKALVHLARGQLEAHWAHQGRRQIECPISAIGDTKASATETRYSGRSFSQMSIPQKIKSGTSSNGCR